MGKLELQSREKTKRKNIQKIILGTIAVAGILSVAILAPNVLGAMNKLGLIPSRRQKEIVKRSREALVRRGLLEYKNGFLRLTEKGKRELRVLEEMDFRLEKPKKWDGKWRIIIFDIKENKRVLRDKVRRTLISIGFAKLQDSVWIYPYDCEELVTMLKADFEIGKDLLYVIVDELEYDLPIRKTFGLS
ncbi:MAG: hypothetical protein WC797_04925 [Candidatus Paceibacterota bacterium]|jgi:hypothetical protein